MVIPDTAATICTTYKCRTRNGTLYSCACICCPTRILGQVCSKSSGFAQGHLVVFVAFLNWALTTAEFIMFAFCLLDVLLCMVTICIVFLTPFERSVTTRRRVCFTLYADIAMIMHNRTVLVANMVLKRTHMVCIPAIAVACSTTVLPRDAHTLTSEVLCVSSPF